METSVPAGPSDGLQHARGPGRQQGEGTSAAAPWTPAVSPRRTLALATITCTPDAGPNSVSTNDPLTTSPPAVSEPSNVAVPADPFGAEKNFVSCWAPAGGRLEADRLAGVGLDLHDLVADELREQSAGRGEPGFEGFDAQSDAGLLLADRAGDGAREHVADPGTHRH